MVDEGFHDPEDSQTEAWQLHQDEGEETLRCDHEADVFRDHGPIGNRGVSSDVKHRISHVFCGT